MVGRVRQQGVTYLWLLFLVFLLGLGLGKSLEVYSFALQREKEADLLYVGGLYRNAIRQYYQSSPGLVKKYPARLEDLLRDPRLPGTHRYLRKLYIDPVSGAPFIPIQAPEGGIWGLRSVSTGKPIRQFPDLSTDRPVPSVSTYQDWRFIYAGGIR